MKKYQTIKNAVVYGFAAALVLLAVCNILSGNWFCSIVCSSTAASLIAS